MAAEPFQRPHNTTANPQWEYAREAVDLIPTCDPTDIGAEKLHFVGQMVLTQGPAAGKRFHEVMLDWQRAALTYTFSTGVQKLLLKVGKGSGKSAMTAAIALGLVMWAASKGKNTRGLVSILAAGVSSADIIFRHIEEGVLADPHLAGQFKTSTMRRSITHMESGIEIQVTPPKSDAAVGRRPFCVICDELHEAAKNRDFSQVYDQLCRGGANWGEEFLQIIITTAPMDIATGLYATTLQEARRVRDGEVDNPNFLAVLFEWPIDREDLDITDPAEWWRGLPSLGATLPLDAIVAEYEEARTAAHSEPMGLFLSQRLGVEPEDRRDVGGLLLQALWPDLPRSDGLPDSSTPIWTAYDPGGIDDPFAVAHLWEADGAMFCYVSQHLTRVGYDRAPANLRQIYDQAISAGELTVHETAAIMDAVIIGQANGMIRGSGGSSFVFGGDLHGRTGFAQLLRARTGMNYEAVGQG